YATQPSVSARRSPAPNPSAPIVCCSATTARPRTTVHSWRPLPHLHPRERWTHAPRSIPRPCSPTPYACGGPPTTCPRHWSPSSDRRVNSPRDATTCSPVTDRSSSALRPETPSSPCVTRKEGSSWPRNPSTRRTDGTAYPTTHSSWPPTAEPRSTPSTDRSACHGRSPLLRVHPPRTQERQRVSDRSQADHR